MWLPLSFIQTTGSVDDGIESSAALAGHYVDPTYYLVNNFAAPNFIAASDTTQIFSVLQQPISPLEIWGNWYWDYQQFDWQPNENAASDVLISLTGQALSYSQGSLTASINNDLAGQSEALSQEALAASIVAVLTGNTEALATGLVIPGVSPSLAGQALTDAQGTFIAQISTALPGQAETESQGTLTPETGTVVQLTGQTVTLSQGTLGVSIDAGLSGAVQTLTQGQLAANIIALMTGQGLVESQGTLTPDVNAGISVALTGQSISYLQGALIATGGDAQQPAGAPSSAKRVKINGKVVTFTPDDLREKIWEEIAKYEVEKQALVNNPGKNRKTVVEPVEIEAIKYQALDVEQELKVLQNYEAYAKDIEQQLIAQRQKFATQYTKQIIADIQAQLSIKQAELHLKIEDEQFINDSLIALLIA